MVAMEMTLQTKNRALIQLSLSAISLCYLKLVSYAGRHCRHGPEEVRHITLVIHPMFVSMFFQLCSRSKGGEVILHNSPRVLVPGPQRD